MLSPSSPQHPGSASPSGPGAALGPEAPALPTGAVDFAALLDRDAAIDAPAGAAAADGAEAAWPGQPDPVRAAAAGVDPPLAVALAAESTGTGGPAMLTLLAALGPWASAGAAPPPQSAPAGAAPAAAAPGAVAPSVTPDRPAPADGAALDAMAVRPALPGETAWSAAPTGAPAVGTDRDLGGLAPAVEQPVFVPAPGETEAGTRFPAAPRATALPGAAVPAAGPGGGAGVELAAPSRHPAPAAAELPTADAGAAADLAADLVGAGGPGASGEGAGTLRADGAARLGSAAPPAPTGSGAAPELVVAGLTSSAAPEAWGQPGAAGAVAEPQGAPAVDGAVDGLHPESAEAVGAVADEAGRKAAGALAAEAASGAARPGAAGTGAGEMAATAAGGAAPLAAADGPPAGAGSASAAAGYSRPAPHPLAAPAQALRALGIQLSGSGEGARLRVAIRPLNLGLLEISAERGEDRVVQIAVLAERPETLRLLQNDTASLEAALMQAGVPAEEGHRLVLGLTDHAAGDGRHGGGADRGAGDSAGVPLEAARSEPAWRAAPSGLLDLTI